MREKSKQHLSTINLLNTNPTTSINNSINGRKSIGNNYINDQLSFDNRNYMKINSQTQQQESNLNHNLVSSLREKFETKINLNNNTEPKTILTKLNHRSQSSSSSSTTTISTSPISPDETKIKIKSPILNEIQTENKYLSIDSSASTTSSLPSPEIFDSNNEKNLLSYFLSLNSIKSINQVLFNNFVYKYLLKFYYSENNIKKFVYLNLIKPLNESCSNDDNDFYKYSIDYAKNLLLLVGNKDFIIEKIDNDGFINDDDEKIDFSSPTELLFELKTKYLFELNKIIEKKLSYFIGKENILHKKIDFNKHVSNKVKIYCNNHFIYQI